MAANPERCWHCGAANQPIMRCVKCGLVSSANPIGVVPPEISSTDWFGGWRENLKAAVQGAAIAVVAMSAGLHGWDYFWFCAGLILLTRTLDRKPPNEALSGIGGEERKEGRE